MSRSTSTAVADFLTPFTTPPAFRLAVRALRRAEDAALDAVAAHGCGGTCLVCRELAVAAHNIGTAADLVECELPPPARRRALA